MWMVRLRGLHQKQINLAKGPRISKKKKLRVLLLQALKSNDPYQNYENNARMSENASSTSEVTQLENLRSHWSELQEQLKEKVIAEAPESWRKDLSSLRLVCGMDISFPKDYEVTGSSVAVASVVICSISDLKVVHEVTEETEVVEPYIPGYLGFREAGPLLRIFNDLTIKCPALKPDVILVDGNGILHPRRYGCACHIGVSTGVPTIGVAKNLYKMDDLDFGEDKIKSLKQRGDYAFIKQRNDILGMALKTSQGAKNPVYISVGHKISLDLAREVVLRCSKFRVPEPIRFADYSSREVIRNSKTIKSHTE